MTHDDYMEVIAQLERENATYRLQLASAKRTLRELDLSTPEGASRLVGVVTEMRDENDEIVPNEEWEQEEEADAK
jgi:hypothetical protein